MQQAGDYLAWSNKASPGILVESYFLHVLLIKIVPMMTCDCMPHIYVHNSAITCGAQITGLRRCETWAVSLWRIQSAVGA